MSEDGFSTAWEFASYSRFDEAKTQAGHRSNTEFFDRLLESSGASMPLYYADYGYLFSKRLNAESFQDDSYWGLEITLK